MKKSISLTLILFLLILAACSSGNNVPSEKKDENKIVTGEVTDEEKALIASHEADVEKALSFMFLALEKYFVEKGNYPENVSTLVDEGYLTQIPINPFTNKSVENVEFGSGSFAGNFSYMPFDVDGSGSVDGFYLIGYGHERTDGDDVDDDGKGDHVIVLLRSGYGDNVPPLEGLLAK